MVEAAQGEMKVVQQKWANRMELPMTEVRPPAAPRPPTPARNRPHPLPPTPRAWNGAVARRLPFPEPELRSAAICVRDRGD